MQNVAYSIQVEKDESMWLYPEFSGKTRIHCIYYTIKLKTLILFSISWSSVLHDEWFLDLALAKKKQPNNFTFIFVHVIPVECWENILYHALKDRFLSFLSTILSLSQYSHTRQYIMAAGQSELKTDQLYCTIG